MLKKHLLIMGLVGLMGAVCEQEASASDASGVTAVSSPARSQSPLHRFFSDLGRWSTRVQPRSMAMAQTAPEASTAAAPVAEEKEQPETQSAQSPAAGADAKAPAEVAAPPVAPKPLSGAEQGAVAEPVDEQAEVDIYAPKKGKKPSRYTARRFAGDGDVLVLPSARPLEEGQVNISLDELVLWRAQLGVTDDLTLEANSLWGFSIGLNGKYSLIRENNTAVSVQAGAGALTVQKHFNWTYGSLLYTRDMGRGAVHAGGHLIFAHTPDGESYLVPQATAGADVRIMKHVTALGELGFGDDILQVSGVENNTGFINLGLRLNGGPAFLTAGLVIPMNESFLDSAALGIPFVRIGGTF